MLIDKLVKASNQLGIKEIAIAGGVSANTYLRSRLQEEAVQNDWQVFIPKFEYCTDNAAMIAVVGELKYKEDKFAEQDVVAKARLKF